MNKPENKLTFLQKRRLPIILQGEMTECGLACLAMISSYFGFRTDIGSLRRKYPITAQGTTLRNIIDIATEMGFKSRPLKFELHHLKQLQLPCILHWDMNHFVVLKEVFRSSITIHDPGIGEKKYTAQEASKHITGVALELSPAQDFTPKKEGLTELKLKISDFWTRITGFKRALIHTIVLSIILQLFIIVGPFYMQLVVDEVISKQDRDLLLVLFVGFGLLHLINLIAETLRSYVLLHIGSLMSFQIVGNLFRHLIHLPMSFFEKRQVGDLISRFQSTEPIKKLLTEDLVAGVVDGLMAITTLVMMFIYSPLLAWVVIGALTVYSLISFALIKLYRERTRETILAKAKEDTTFIETIRAMQAIRLFGKENDRENVWQNNYAAVINSTVKLGRINITYGFLSTLFTSIVTLLVIYLGARLVLDAELSVGMIFAFVAWKGQFSEKVLSLIQKGLDLKMLSLHLQRLADIVHTGKEEFFNHPVNTKQEVSGRLETRKLSFSYGMGMPHIFTNIDMTLEQGEMLALTGPSGCGKTTFMKILTGLLPPSEGGIFIDDQELGIFGIQNYRRQIATVMQDDQLLSGSLLDNICFFDPEPDLAHIEESARKACIHDEIMMMAMQYQSLVGDMGTFLSGGQKQRVLLARAIYRNPKILLIDEGTSHLDVEMERKVNENLKRMNITRLIISHRPETIKMADRILLFTKNGLIPSID